MDKNYIDVMQQAIADNQLAIVSGGYMEEFEVKAAELFGNKYAVSTCNGTSALYLSLFCIKDDSERNEVIVPAYCFHGTVSAICAFGLKPIFCDIDPDTLAIDFDKCESLINDKTLAIMVLHPWGNIADLDKMSALRKYNLYFLSDSSHAHGATWDGQPIGKFFDINCASFGMGKLISGGELGVLTTDNPEFRDRALLFSHTNRVPKALSSEKYQNISNAVGIKFRPHFFALLLALENFKTYRAESRNIEDGAKRLMQELSSSPQIKFASSLAKAKRAYWKPIVILPDSTDSQKIVNALAQEGTKLEDHNYKVLLPDDSIFTEFHNIKSTNEYPNADSVIKKRILHIPGSCLANETPLAILIRELKTVKE